MRSSRLWGQEPHASISGFAPPAHQLPAPRQSGQEQRAAGVR
ncbi:hypothetical protein [Streptomyces sp. KN37]|nr:hypothetical protein [Streptomyces sp. KN37]WPO76281.1 hypothetical protein R9806_37015 [Streptomyces sp. KN37]